MEFYARKGSIFYGDRKIKIKGVNWFGFETEVYGLHGLWSVSMESLLDFVQAHGFNAIRLPFSAEVALGLDTLKCTAVNASANPSLVGCTAGQMMDRFMDECLKRGILVMPDLHRFVGTGSITQLWYDDALGYPESRVIEAWLRLVRRYARYPNFFAVDLKNEPHGKATWGTGNLATDWDAAARRIGNAILAVNPRLLIVVEGVEIGPGNDNSWWGGTIGALRTHPIRLNVPDKLVYSPHVYGPSVFPQPYFADPNFPNNLEPIWDRHFGFAEGKPFEETILIGEWGGKYQSHNKDDVWQDTIGEYFARKGFDWFYWCLNRNSGDTNGLVLDDWKTPETAKLELLKKICPDPTQFQPFRLLPLTTPPPPPPTRPSNPPTTPPAPPAPASPARPQPTPPTPPPPQNGLTIRATVRQTWTEGSPAVQKAVIDVTVSNQRPTPARLEGSRVRIVSSSGQFKIDQVWNAEIVPGSGGGSVIVRLPPHAGTLQPGQTFTFGFIATSPGTVTAQVVA